MVHMGGALFYFSTIASLIPRSQTAFCPAISGLGTRLYILFMSEMMYSVARPMAVELNLSCCFQ